MFEFKKTSHRQKQKVLTRVWVAGVFALLCFGALLARLWVLQVVRYDGLSARADQNRIAVVPIPPRRGEIVDRNGVVLAKNYRDYTLEVVPAYVKGSMRHMLDTLGTIVYISPRDRRSFLRTLDGAGRYSHILLRNNLNSIEASWFAAHAYEYPGVELRARWVREYPQGETAAHVVGFVGRISDSDLEELDKEGKAGNYRGTEVIGKRGIEKSYESVLHGRTGVEEVEVTASGRPVRVLHRTDPVPGSNLVLSIDIGLQKVAEEQFKGKRGALVAIDPKTGAVLAFVSAPSYDPNLFVDGIDVENWNKLNNDPAHPLIDRPITATYPVGSTYKPFVALAALQMGKRSPTELIPDPGYFEFGGEKFHNAAGEAFGPTDMHKAIVVSSDTYFFSLGPIIGVDALHDFTKQFGFGQLTGIDLDGEKRGVLPSTEWKRHAFKKPSQQRWYAGESVSIAVGQGYDAFTMMQLAHATATLADNGVSMKPHLVSLIENPETGAVTHTVTKPSYTIPLKPENLHIVQDAMKDVVRVGTARNAFKGAPYQAAGKTGTAQVYSLKGVRPHRGQKIPENLRDHALFIAYAPYDDPRIAVALIVEHGGWGASVAAPIARKLFDYWLSPTRTENENLVSVPPSLAAQTTAYKTARARSPVRTGPPDAVGGDGELIFPGGAEDTDMEHGVDSSAFLSDTSDTGGAK
ncbi:MAG TPA: penicillin-binding protein 2 [Burkholderiaceae bacterium]|nr:penicillin-binding protein 2 [Burkholderiaceae bacterium]